MAAEITVTFRDDNWNPDNEEYELWLTGTLEAIAGITVLSVDEEEC
jgi:hypothetical protein